jgi:hypothetical protein
MLDLEELEEKDLEQIRDKYEALAAAARKKLGDCLTETGSPEVEN